MPQPNDLRLLAGEARRLASSADTLSIVLAGHRRLKNDLRRPSIEEIGSRATTIFDLDGSGREKRKFFVASLAEVAQEVQRAALHHRAQLWQGLVR
jgi:type II secretory pathway predicted ATPase ExeA